MSMPSAPPVGPHSYTSLRERLDEMGYFQGFLPECLPLVEALFNDLLTTTHNLKIHKDKLLSHSQSPMGKGESFQQSETSTHSEKDLSSSCSSFQTPPNLIEYEKKEEDLKKQLSDLEALNAHALKVISNLQGESLEKSKKISKLESKNSRARISERNVVSNKPKMEITAYIKDSKSAAPSISSRSSSSCNAENTVHIPKEGSLDIIKMFENKNKMLSDLIQTADEENRSLKTQLSEVQSDLRKYKTAPSNSNPNPKSSSYISKILKDNAALKEQVKSLEGKGGLSSKAVLSRSQCHRIHHQHHDERNKENERTGQKAQKHMEDQHYHIHELEDQLCSAHDEIRELKLRVSHLISSKKYLTDKVGSLDAQQKVLANSKDASKIQDLVSFMEKQRNIYRDNVHELLEQLDPDQPRVASSKKVRMEEVPVVLSGSCAECRRKKLASSKPRKENASTEHLQEYKECISALKKEKSELISRLEEQEREIKEKESEIASTRDKMDQWRSRASYSHSQELGNEYLTRELQSSRDRIIQIEGELKIKEGHLRDISDEKDEILRLLDEKTISYEKLKGDKLQMLNELNQLDSDRAATDQRVASVMSQMNALQLEMKTRQRERDDFRGRYEREKTVGLQLRRENNDLRMEAEEAIRDKAEAQGREMDITTHIQKYINEVKRIEELLSICEKERSELLEQYKHLSSDASSAEVHNRQLESKVASLEFDLKEKEIELNAAETRLQDLQKDFAEASLSNENFRSQLASFTVRADLAESELKEARNQHSWINNDLSSVHELAVTLNSQKVELINKISNQESEIHDMSQEIERLKSELSFLRREHHEEKMKSKVLQSKISILSSNASGPTTDSSSSS